MRKVSIILAVIICLLYAGLAFAQPDVHYEIIDTDALNGYDVFVAHLLIDDILQEADFLFEENGFIRFYAFQMWDQTIPTILPDSTYIVKEESLAIGDQWRFWLDDGPVRAEVVDTQIILVPADTFDTYVIDYYDINTDELVLTIWFSYDFGWVKMVWVGDDPFLLTDYSIMGGSGYFPLNLGNWWIFNDTLTGIENEENPPRQFSLGQNFPNPFNASTMIGYELPLQSQVIIDIYNLLGRKVETLVNNIQQAGYHQVIWNANDKTSGMYFYKIQAGDYIETKKMVLAK